MGSPDFKSITTHTLIFKVNRLKKELNILGAWVLVIIGSFNGCTYSPSGI